MGQDHPHGISLLVHERVDVVASQCANFELFAPHSLIMIHVSASATFGRDELAAALAEAGCVRSRINPVSRQSAWGNIINGHFENIAAMADWLADDAAVSLHASNDMLLRELPEATALRQPRYELREVSASSIWYTGRRFAASDAFAALLRALDCPRPVGSQVEGSVYPFALLRELAAAVEPLTELMAALPAVAEEVVFPTWGAARLGAPAAAPYILFRPNLPVAWSVAAVPAPLRPVLPVDLIHKAVGRVAGLFASPYARPADVEAVIAGKRLPAHSWTHGAPPRPAETFYGIKRIARTIDDPLRVRIVDHGAAVSAGRRNRTAAVHGPQIIGDVP